MKIRTTLDVLDAQAFPDEIDSGMTLKDYFAGQALMGLLAHPDSSSIASPKDFARDAYKFANAMLVERQK